MTYFSKETRPGWIFVLVMLAVMAILQLFGPGDLRYQVDWLTQHEYWRLLTAHWVHVNWRHLMLNGVGLVLVMGIASPRWMIRQWLVYNLILALGISLLFWLRNPQLGWYAGYSGVLFGLYLLAAIDLFAGEKIVALLLAAAISIKVILEQTSDLQLNSSEFIDSPVIIDAHLYGLLIGLSIALVQRAYTMGDRSGKTGV
jgi:rhomboid family GlyGly-CTERM serine protease